MIFFILTVGACGYLVWRKVQKLKVDNFPINKKRLLYMPIAQFFFCFLWCMVAFAFDGNLPQDEINQFIKEYEFVGDLSSALLGLDLSQDEVSMYMIVRSLHNKATYILIASFIMMFIQIVGSYRLKLDKLIVEGISVIHTFFSFYMCYLLLEAFLFMVNQMGTMKLLNAISGDNNTSPISKDNLSIWVIPVSFAVFHYLYHFVLEKYYEEQKLNP